MVLFLIRSLVIVTEDVVGLSWLMLGFIIRGI